MCVCSACGVLIACALIFLAYRYLSSSGEAKVEQQESKVEQEFKVKEQEFKVAEKIKSEAKVERQHKAAKTAKKKMSTWKVFESGIVPDFVLSQMKDVTVLKKSATFSVGDQVSFVQRVPSVGGGCCFCCRAATGARAVAAGAAVYPVGDKNLIIIN